MVTNAQGQQVLQGDGTWFYAPFIDGANLTARNVKGTNWGDSNDAMDSGTTACNFSTRDHPGFLGVSLAFACANLSPAERKALGGCPLPHLPWYTKVRVYSHQTGLWAIGYLIDLGPAKWTKHAIDMTDGLVRKLGLELNDVYDVDFAVLGGAQYVGK